MNCVLGGLLEERHQSAAQPPIEPDARQRSPDEQDTVERHLSMRIDERHYEERREPPAKRGERDLEYLARGAARATMVLGQVPLAAWTGRHGLMC